MVAMNRMQSTRFYAIILISVMVAAIFSLSLGISSFMSRNIIGTTGGIDMGTSVMALSGYVEDIQAAVDAVAAEGSGKVYVPAGEWIWAAGDQTVEIPGGVNVFGSGYTPPVGREGKGTATFNTILRLPFANSPTHTTMFKCTGTNGLPIRISGIAFMGRSSAGQLSSCGDTAISMEVVKDFRVDHCRIDAFGSNGVAVAQFSNTGSGPGSGTWRLCQGVVDHCDIVNMLVEPCLQAHNGYGYGVAMDKREGTDLYVWTQTPQELAGIYYDNTYVEDCYFSHGRHAICNVLGSTSVFRYNYLENWGRPSDGGAWMVDQHPPRTYTGGRWMEVYGNELHGAGSQWCHGIGIYGGGGIVFNNVLYGEGGMYWAHTFGASDTTTQEIWNLGRTHDVWLWGNTYNGVFELYYTDSPSGFPSPEEGVDFYFRAPTVEQDGFVYTPYPYPHPLTLGSAT